MFGHSSSASPSCQKSWVSVVSIDVRSRLIGSMESVPVDEPVIRLYTVPETSTGKSGRSFRESRSTWKVDLGDWGGPVTVTSSGAFLENRRADESNKCSSNLAGYTYEMPRNAIHVITGIYRCREYTWTSHSTFYIIHNNLSPEHISPLSHLTTKWCETVPAN